MKFFSLLTGVALSSMMMAVESKLHFYNSKRQLASGAPALQDVPGYNFTIPVDHFTPSDTRTYSNRYWVNDTYYKAGGPVILFDLGEMTFDLHARATVLAEYNGSVSSPMRLAARLNGLVIGWEHRYYGYSQPFPIDETAGTPTNGAIGYKGLTVQQALEDLVYFANRFNTSKLERNTVVQSTANLDPYHTPWIHVGASYPGARAAWSRLRNPEVFYANWASSAPVQVMMDGSTYRNPVARSLPSNCTKDLRAISAYVDQVFASGEPADIRTLQAGAYLMQPQFSSSSDVSAAYKYTGLEVFNIMSMAARDGDFQTYGPRQTIQVFCDYLQSFDTQYYLDARKQLTVAADIRDVTALGILNRGGARPSTNGIVADNGQYGPFLGFVAFTYAFRNYINYKNRFFSEDAPDDQREVVDAFSWVWQTVAQMGYFQYSNVTTSYFSSQSDNLATTMTYLRNIYSSFRNSDFPTKPDTSYALSFGGWNMNPSNVMFTNGEYDPWRAFGVHSQEVGAPTRRTTTEIPKCNTPPSGTDVFGILYKGAVHVEDMVTEPDHRRASEEPIKPTDQGVDLFARAYNTWLPCFTQSRDSIRNGKGVDGHGNSASGSSSTPSSISIHGFSSRSVNNAQKISSIDGHPTWLVLLLSVVPTLFSMT